MSIGLGALVAVLLYFWLQFTFSSEEARVRSFILEGRRAAESRNILACAGLISKDYADKYHNDRQSLIYIAREVFAYYKTIIISIDKMDIRFNEDKDKATVEIVAMVLCRAEGHKTEKVFEGEKGLVRIKIIKEEGRWRLLEAEPLERLTLMGQTIEMI